MTSDSDSRRDGENSRSEVEGKARQSGAESASPELRSPTAEPITDAMIEAGVKALHAQFSWTSDNAKVAAIYLAMRSTAPQEPDDAEWRSIETARRDEDVYILAIRAGAIVPFVASYDADFDNWYTFNGALENCGKKFEPTHWMPLPKAPEGEG